MPMKKYLFLAIVFCIFWFLFYLYKQGVKTGVNEQKIITQESTIKVQENVIKEVKKVVKRRQENISVSINDDLLWLQKHACSDCNATD